MLAVSTPFQPHTWSAPLRQVPWATYGGRSRVTTTTLPTPYDTVGSIHVCVKISEDRVSGILTQTGVVDRSDRLPELVWREDYSPVKFGGRFSRKLRTPSR